MEKPKREISIKRDGFEKMVTLMSMLFSDFDPQKATRIVIEYDPDAPRTRVKYF